VTARVAVVGAGLIGRAWSLAFARAGLTVALWDPAEGAAEATRAALPGVLDDLARAGLLDEPAAAVAARVSAAPSLAAALDGAGHVQENAPERLEAKRPLYAELDRLAAPETVLASSTSGLPPSAISDGLDGRARCLVAHPINPPYLVPAVEIVPAPWTAPEAVERARDLMSRIGQSPIVMAREIDGFVMNRLQGALLDEAFRLVAEGYASAEDVDRGVRDGLGLRWAFMGPFETIDLNAPKGVRDYVERYDGLYQTLAGDHRKRADWAGEVLDRIEAERRALLPEERLSERQLWRDRRLMALIRWKREQGAE
jgi:3-hydroxyacyl-CoA dehydrogenase